MTINWAQTGHFTSSTASPSLPLKTSALSWLCKFFLYCNNCMKNEHASSSIYMEVSIRSVCRPLVPSLQMRPMGLDDWIQGFMLFSILITPLDVIKLPSPQWRSYWASLEGKINGVYSFIPHVILVLIRREKSLSTHSLQFRIQCNIMIHEYKLFHKAFLRPTESEMIRKCNLRRAILFIALLQQYFTTNAQRFWIEVNIAHTQRNSSLQL